MPNSEPKIYPYGSRQKRMENFNSLVDFLRTWRKSPAFAPSRQNLVAERFCDVNFQYGHVTKKDIVEQALMKVNLL